MRVFSLVIPAAAVLGAALLAACQGNIGGGTGLSVPQAPGYGAPAGPGAAYQQPSRERVLDGAVYLSPKLNALPLPQVDGFSVTIALGTPGPSAEPSGSPSAAASGAARTGKAAARPLASPSPAGSASPADASPAASSTASPASAASGAASPSASGSPSAKPSPHPSGSANAYPKINTKTTVYPDDAPPPPTPVPTGEVQTFVKRDPLVRGYVQPETDVALYGLSAIKFTVPQTELLPKRGFTIAVYQSGKHHHDTLLHYDTDATVSEQSIASAQSEPFVLKKGNGYLLVLYGDQSGVPATPAPVPSGYPGPGNNPFPMPSGYGAQPSYTQVPYGVTPTPYNPYATPTPYNPYAPATPYNPYATPTPYPH